MSDKKTERMVKGYLKPCNHNFIVKYAEVNGISKSQAINEAAKALKACQPPDILQRILSKNTF